MHGSDCRSQEICTRALPVQIHLVRDAMKLTTSSQPSSHKEIQVGRWMLLPRPRSTGWNRLITAMVIVRRFSLETSLSDEGARSNHKCASKHLERQTGLRFYIRGSRTPAAKAVLSSTSQSTCLKMLVFWKPVPQPVRTSVHRANQVSLTFDRRLGARALAQCA